MGRRKKNDISIKECFTPTNESIADMFETINHEDEITNGIKKRKYVKKNILIKDGPSKIMTQEEIEKKNEITKEKLEVLDIVLKENPHLKKNKQDLIDKIFHNTPPKQPPLPKEYVLDKITIEDKIYYRDNNCNVIDINQKLVGFYQNEGVLYEYIFFNQ